MESADLKKEDNPRSSWRAHCDHKNVALFSQGVSWELHHVTPITSCWFKQVTSPAQKQQVRRSSKNVWPFVAYHMGFEKVCCPCRPGAGEGGEREV